MKFGILKIKGEAVPEPTFIVDLIILPEPVIWD